MTFIAIHTAVERAKRLARCAAERAGGPSPDRLGSALPVIAR
jgi:hypothetical protein